MEKMASDIRYSQNYIWSINEVLGKGATSIVYRGINRLTGSAVAIKTFTHSFHSDREFEVLRKINHENIVKMLAVEWEEDRTPRKNKARRPILVMEMCTGGCLNDILDKPENVYGLEDSEFLKVLSHLYAGMKYLRDNDIIHRDLKPGNIMKFLKDDGSVIYKLIDFGAARELSDEKDFKSLYGTEEYLYPDMYARAVLGATTGKTFRATVDLWSIGVTLYHIVTGQLPFRPFGGRRNRATMHYITTQKGTAVISGVQNKPNGPIDFSTELPESCLLSMELRKIVTPLIASLVESDSIKIWSYEQFFKEVSSILAKKVVHVFDINKPELIKVYLDPDDGIDELQNHIHLQTSLAPDKQILIYKYYLIKTCNIPQTTQNSPLLLFSKEDIKGTIPLLQVFSRSITFSRPIDAKEDARQAKIVCSDAHQIKRLIETFAIHGKLMNKTVETLSNYLNNEFKDMALISQHLLDKAQMLKQMADILEFSQSKSNYQFKINGIDDLKLMTEKFKDDVFVVVSDLHKKHVAENYLRTEWDSNTKDIANIQYTIRAKILVEQLEDARQHLTKGREDLPLPTSDQYMIDREKIKTSLTSLINLLENEVYPVHKLLTEIFHDWCRTAQADFLKIDILTTCIKDFETNLEKFHEKVLSNNLQYNNDTECKQVTKPSVMNKHLANQLKEYISNTDRFNIIIKENSQLRNELDGFDFKLEQ